MQTFDEEPSRDPNRMRSTKTDLPHSDAIDARSLNDRLPWIREILVLICLTFAYGISLNGAVEHFAEVLFFLTLPFVIWVLFNQKQKPVHQHLADKQVEKQFKAVLKTAERNEARSRKNTSNGPLDSIVESTPELYELLKNTGIGEEGYTQKGGQNVYLKADKDGLSLWRWSQDPLPFLTLKWKAMSKLVVEDKQLLIKSKSGHVLPLSFGEDKSDILRKFANKVNSQFLG